VIAEPTPRERALGALQALIWSLEDVHAGEFSSARLCWEIFTRQAGAL